MTKEDLFGKRTPPELPPDEDTDVTSGEDAIQGETSGDEDEIVRLQEENSQLRDQALRALAEVENIRRRAAQDRNALVQYANEGLLRNLLPIVDDVRRSIESGDKARDFEPFFSGISMINDKLARMLDQLGVRRIETVGRMFDVETHEALVRQPSDTPEGTVIGEIEPGYYYGDKVLRHARVVVSAGSGEPGA